MAQRQFRSDDTDRWTDGFGDGSDGAYSSAGNATDAPIDSSCSGTSGQNTLTATNASFAAGQLILIHQTRGTGVGSWELNKIASYVAGTITLAFPLVNTYTDSGASQAQVLVMKKYSSFTQNAGHTLTAKAWNGNVGGIIAFFCSGTTSIAGILSASSKGFLVGDGSFVAGNNSCQINTDSGEGTAGASVNASNAANGNGGGAGGNWNGSDPSGSGGGAGHAAAGSAGTGYTLGGCQPAGGQAGAAVGNADLTLMNFGGGGGAGGARPSAGANGNTGGLGGGIILIITKDFSFSGAGAIGASASDGSGATSASGGGGGAGGAILIKGQTIALGTNKIVVNAGNGGVRSGQNTGGAGSVGRIHADYKTSISGSTTPTTDSRQDASLDWLTGGAFLFNML